MSGQDQFRTEQFKIKSRSGHIKSGLVRLRSGPTWSGQVRSGQCHVRSSQVTSDQVKLGQVITRSD